MFSGLIHAAVYLRTAFLLKMGEYCIALLSHSPAGLLYALKVLEESWLVWLGE